MKFAADRELAVLLVEDNPADAEWIQEVLEESRGGFSLRRVERLAQALEQLSREAFDLVLLDLMLPDSAGLETFLQVRRLRPDTALVVLSGLQDEELALRAVRQGAQDYLVKTGVPPEMLARTLRYAVERQRTLAQARLRSPRPLKAGEVIAFLGAKGGVGTTTVAANVAAALARHGAVIAAELDGCGAGLCDWFRIPNSSASVWEMDHPEETDVSRRLWKLPSGLRILPGPSAATNLTEITAAQVEAVLEALSWMAERVILDLPSRASAAVGAAIRRATAVLLVLEREPGAVAAARRMLEFLRSVCLVQGLIRAVVVNRVSFACPMSLAEIQQQLEIPVAAVIPPNPDLLVQARKSGSPVVFCQPDSAVGASLIELAEKLAEATLAAAQRA